MIAVILPDKILPMGFFSKLFRKRDNAVSIPFVKQAGAAGSDENMELYRQAVDILTVTSALKNELNLKLEKAFKEPHVFYDDSSEFISSDRGLFYPRDVLLTPKFVFIDTLVDNRLMAEVDWKEAEEEIRFAISSIIKAKEYDLSFSLDNRYDGSDTFSVIEKINSDELRPNGYSLEILDIHSDCYVFTIVTREEQPLVRDLFEKMK